MFTYLAEAPAAVSIHLGAEIQDVDTLFWRFYDTLSFPGYFGFNWDALSDCLRDLSWLKPAQSPVVIWHAGLPNLSDADLMIYLGVLLEAANSWAAEPSLELAVMFDQKLRPAVEQITEHRPVSNEAVDD